MSALADGQLDHHDRDRLLAHLAHCVGCRTAAEAERRVRETLRLMPEPDVPARLSAALLALPLASPLDDGGPPVPRRPATLPRDPAGAAAWLAAIDAAEARVPASRGGAAAHRPAGRSGSRGPGGPHGARLTAVALGAAVVGSLALSGAAAGGLRGTTATPVQQLRLPAAATSGDAATLPPRPAARWDGTARDLTPVVRWVWSGQLSSTSVDAEWAARP